MSDLATLEHAFYTGDFASVLSTGAEGLDGGDQEKGFLLVQRALIHSGKARDVAGNLAGASSPARAATKLYADYVLGDSAAAAAAEARARGADADATAKHLAGVILAAEGRLDDALAVLATAENSLECVMLTVYIYLRQNRQAAAAKLVQQTRGWANDHVVFNLAEAWVALREGGESAQKAYYIFEENNSLTPTASSHLGEAVAQLELRRFPEAAEALRQAQALEPAAEDVLATTQALSAIQSTEFAERDNLLKLTTSAAVVDVREKSELFDKVVAKYAAAA